MKYFFEKIPELALTCAGSLLGVVHGDSSFPVGKVSFMNLYPMTFEEFLLALNDNQSLDYINNLSLESSYLPEIIHNHLMDRLREYMITGGMPEIVEDYITSNASKMEKFEKIRIKQNELLTAYRGDFAKYSGKVHANSIISVFESIPAQLAKDNKRFIASKVEGEGRFSKLKSSIDWLLGAGLLIQVKITNRGELPLSAFTKDNLFKLYFFDTGLLGALGGLSPKAIYLEQNLFATYKGAFCENFIAQEFTASEGNKLYSWMNNTSEVEFLREIDGELFPIEVKAGLSGKLKSLNVYVSKYNPPYRTRFSARNLEINHQSQMHSYPLYLAGRFPLSASTPE